MFRFLWIRELHRMHVPISAGFVEGLLVASWVVVAVYAVVYLAHLRRTVRSGGSINPVKYGFIAASYFLWYYPGWWGAGTNRERCRTLRSLRRSCGRNNCAGL